MTNTKQTGSPVDFDHLHQYTAGDTALEREVLSVFVQQTDMWLRVLHESGDGDVWKDAAHTLKGSARGIGAWQVADLCERAEALGADASPAERSIALGDLRIAIDDVVRCIDSRLYQAEAS